MPTSRWIRRRLGRRACCRSSPPSRRRSEVTTLGDIQDTRSPALRISALSHRYGKIAALTDIALDIPAGATVGFVGPDGVGKSTLLSLIAGAKRIQAGHVEVLGGDMAEAEHRRAIGGRIAFMPQG